MVVKTHFKTLQEEILPLSNFQVISTLRRHKNLKDLLVHASLKEEKKERKDPHFRQIQYIRNKFTGLGAPVWKTLHLESSNLICIVECRICGKLYVGQTKKKLIQRLKQHLYHINRENKQTELYKHFNDHGKENLMISGLESRPHWTMAQRLRAERRWVEKLQTLKPSGLNEI